MAAQERPDIFVSFKYKSWAEGVADELVKRLSQTSVAYYRLKENRPVASQDFVEIIDREIKRSSGVLHIISDGCYKSRFFKMEYRAALHYKKPRALIVRPGADPPLDWPEERWHIILRGVDFLMPGRNVEPVNFTPAFDEVVKEVDTWARESAAGHLNGDFYTPPRSPIGSSVAPLGLTMEATGETQYRTDGPYATKG